MHDLLEPRTRARTDLREFREAYERARATWTAVATRAGDPRQVSHPRVGAARRPLDVEVAISVPTRVFGTVQGSVLLPVSERGVVWSKHLAFPHLRRGERLSRRTKAPPRAPITDRHGTTIVSGPASDRQARTAGAESIAGALERPRGAKEERAIYRRGFPVRTPQGVSGLESMLEAGVAGKPGGVLRAGDRVIASSGPRPARRVTSTVDLDLQGASDRALGERQGGIAALDAQTGEIRALSGLAFSAPQPPGSTFKIVTATAALEARLVEPSTRFPVERRATVEGTRVENSDGEAWQAISSRASRSEPLALVQLGICAARREGRR